MYGIICSFAKLLTYKILDMKKLLFLLVIAFPLVFTSCSKDDENNNDNELKFIQIKVTSADTPTPNGNVYLFKVSGYNVNDDYPLFWSYGNLAYTPTLSYKYNGEESAMLPVSEYGSKYKGDLLLSEKDGYSVHSIYWYNLSSLYGTPQIGDEYLIFVTLRNGTYAKASKRFIITKNSLITVKLPTCKDKSKFVDGEWTISDYSSN